MAVRCVFISRSETIKSREGVVPGKAIRTLLGAIICVTALENYCAASAPFADEPRHPSIFTAQEYVSHIGTEWPKHYGLILTDQISTCLASSGQFGDGFG